MLSAQVEPRTIDEEIGPAITRIRNINFFKPERTLEEANLIIPEVEKLIAAHKEALRPWKQGRQSWNTARYAVGDATWNAAGGETWYVARDAAWYATWNAVGYATRGAAGDARMDATMDAARYTVFELVKGRELAQFKDRQNPYDSILGMYELGLKPDRFRNVDGGEKIVVDFPLSVFREEEHMLGCYAEGDKSLQWYHGWTEYAHSNLMPVKIAPRKVAPRRIV